jgi:hypothetical protein
VDKDGGFDYLIAFTVTSFALLAISLFSKQITERTLLVVGVSLLLATCIQSAT